MLLAQAGVKVQLRAGRYGAAAMPTELMHGQPVRSVNLMMKAGGSLYEVCEPLFLGAGRVSATCGRSLRPASSTSVRTRFPAHVASFELSWLGQHHVQGDQAKLSIHATGRVHVRLDPHRPPIEAGPILGPSLQTMRYDHIATLIADEFTALRPVTRTTTMQGTEVRFGFPFDSHPTGRVAIYANAYEPVFSDTEFWFRMNPKRRTGVVHRFGGPPKRAARQRPDTPIPGVTTTELAVVSARLSPTGQVSGMIAGHSPYGFNVATVTCLKVVGDTVYVGGLLKPGLMRTTARPMARWRTGSRMEAPRAISSREGCTSALT